MCRFKDDDECLFYFTYEYDDDNVIHIVVQQTKGRVLYLLLKASDFISI